MVYSYLMNDYPDLNKKKPSLETPSLILAYLREDQSETIFNAWASDSTVTRYLTWNPHKEVKETERLLRHWVRDYADPRNERFGLYKKENGELIGMIDIVCFEKEDDCPALGYVMKRSEWGHGYMTEALGAFADYLFSLGYPRLHISAMKDNIGSNRVICKNSFRLIRSSLRPLGPCKQDIILTRNDYVKDNPNLLK